MTYGVFALSGSAIAIIAIVTVILTVTASFLIHAFGIPLVGFIAMDAALVLSGILTATFWTLPDVWAVLPLTFVAGIIIFAVPFLALAEH